VKMCLQSGLAVRRNVLARNIGIHPSNRACTGVDPVNAQNLTQWVLKWQRPGNTAHFPGQKYT
jgi:hypothetical protein